MAKAIRFHKAGGPEVLQLDDVQVGDPGPGQVRIKHTAIGVNYVDTYQRSGLYPMPMPQVAGNEGAGVVEAVGAGVSDLKAGDRVTYTGLIGSYCESRVVPADRMVKLPQGISDALAYVDAQEFAATVKDQIDWLKRHKVDVVLVGLQFAPQMLRDAHYIEIRDSLRRLAVQENVIVIRFFEAMQMPLKLLFI